MTWQLPAPSDPILRLCTRPGALARAAVPYMPAAL